LASRPLEPMSRRAFPLEIPENEEETSMQEIP
jgi:hypothetical protein